MLHLASSSLDTAGRWLTHESRVHKDPFVPNEIHRVCKREKRNFRD